MKKSSIFGSSSNGSSANNGPHRDGHGHGHGSNQHTGGAGTGAGAGANKSASALHHIKESKKKRPHIPIYGSNGKVINNSKKPDEVVGPAPASSAPKRANSQPMSRSTSAEHNAVNDETETQRIKKELLLETSSLSSINTDDVNKASAALSNEYKVPKPVPAPIKEEPEPAQNKENSDNEESDTDAEDDPPVLSHKGRRLLRKMEYDDQIQKKKLNVGSSSSHGNDTNKTSGRGEEEEEEEQKHDNKKSPVESQPQPQPQPQPSQQPQPPQQQQIHVPKRNNSETTQLKSSSRSVSPSRKHSRNFSSKDALGRTKLQKSCIKGNYELAKEYIEQGANVNEPDHAGNTPLHEAALNGHFDIAKLLIDNGAKINVQSGPDDLDTPLIDACAYNHIEIIKLLLDHGADPLLINASGQNAMDSIDPDEKGAIEATKLIRVAMKNVGVEHHNNNNNDNNAEDQSRKSSAATTSTNPPAPHLTRNDTWIDLTTKEGREEIYSRAVDGDEAFVGNYLANGGKPHPKALILAARHGHSNVVSLLLAFGAKIEKAVEGETALMQTVGRGHFETVKMLLDNGADPTRVDKSGVSVLDRAKDPDLVTDEDEIKLITEAIAKKTGKSLSAPAPAASSSLQQDQQQEALAKPMKKTNSSKNDTDLKRKHHDVKESDHTSHEVDQFKKRKKETHHQERMKLGGSISPLTTNNVASNEETKPIKNITKESTPPVVHKAQSPVPAPAPVRAAASHSPVEQPAPVAAAATTTTKASSPTVHGPAPAPAAVPAPVVAPIPQLTPEEEAAKAQREAELQKQREQWELHKKQQREQKALDIMKRIEENKKRREEQEKKLAEAKEKERELQLKAEEEAKLAKMKKLQQQQVQEEISRRKQIRELYVPGLKNASFGEPRTVTDALKYLPLHVITLQGNDKKDYVVDLQVSLFLGVENLYEKFPNLFKTSLTDDEKFKVWRFFHPIIGIDFKQFHQLSTEDLQFLQNDGLNKFQTYDLNWIQLDDVVKILEDDEFKYLQNATKIRWIIRCELDETNIKQQQQHDSTNGSVSSISSSSSPPRPLSSSLASQHGQEDTATAVAAGSSIKESSLPYKFRGNKKLLEIITSQKMKKSFF